MATSSLAKARTSGSQASLVSSDNSPVTIEAEGSDFQTIYLLKRFTRVYLDILFGLAIDSSDLDLTLPPFSPSPPSSIILSGFDETDMWNFFMVSGTNSRAPNTLQSYSTIMRECLETVSHATWYMKTTDINLDFCSTRFWLSPKKSILRLSILLLLSSLLRFAESAKSKIVSV